MPDQLTHPSPEELGAYSLGQLPPEEAAVIESHISQCEPCCETIVGLSSDDTFVALLQEARRLPADQTVELDGGSPDSNSSLPDIPRPLGEHPRYDVIGLIGKGGMGDVYKARHRMMDRAVALKIINRELVCKPEAVDRFHREVKTAARLAHPNIVTAYDAEQAGDVHFLVMEYVDGVDLAHTVKQQGPLPIKDACDYVRQAAIGLQYAHELGMVHRDIKPHNLMVTVDGTVKILDFGLASLAPDAVPDADTLEACGDLTAAGSIMGTPDFISPEQADDAHQADIRSDIYSLGTTLYYLLSGQPPFADGSVMHKLKSHAQAEPEPIQNIQADVPDELAVIIRRMMAKDPAERYQTPAEVAEALTPFVSASLSNAAETLDAVPQPDAKPSGQRRRRIPIVAVALLGLIAALLAAAVFYIQLGKTTLKFEISDPAVEVKFGEEVVSFRDRQGSGAVFTIKPGTKQTFAVEQNGAVVETDSLVLNRGDKVVLRINVVDGDLKIVSSKDVPLDRHPRAKLEPADVQPQNSSVVAQPDSTELTLLQTYQGLDSFVHHLDVSRDSKWLLAGSGNPYDVGMVWEIESGKIVSRNDDHQSMIYRNIFTPDASLVLMAHWSGGVTVWDPKTGEARGRIGEDEHDGRLEYLAVSPDGKYLATGTTSYADAHSRGNYADVSFRIFDLATRKLVHRHNFATDTVKHGGIWELQFSPDGTRLLVAVELYPDAKIDSANSGFVEEFEVGSWKSTRRMFESPQQGSKARSLCYSPDGLWIATGHQALEIPNERWWDDPDNSVIRLWDAKTFQLVRTLRGHRGSVRSIDFSPDSKLLVSGNSYQWDKAVAVEAIQYTIRLWDVATGREITQAKVDETIQCVRFTRDGKSIISASGGLGQKPSIQRWRLPDSQVGRIANPSSEELLEVGRLQGHTGPVRWITVSSDGRLVASTSGYPQGDKTVRVWNLEIREQIQKFVDDDQMLRAQFTRDGKRLLASGAGGRAYLWELASGREVYRIDGTGGWMRGCALTPDESQVVIASGGRWNPRVIELRDAATGERTKELSRSSDSGFPLAFDLSPDGKLLLCRFNNNMQLFDLPAGNVARTLTGHTDPVEVAAFSHDGKYIISGGQDDVLRLWEVATGREIRQFTGHTDTVMHVAFAPDDRHVVSCGHDGTVRVWNVQTAEEVTQLQNGLSVWCVAVTPDGKHVICGGGSNREKPSPSATERDYDLRILRLPESVWPKVGRIANPSEDDSAAARAFFRTFERTIQESRGASVIYVGEVETQKDGTTTRQKYWGAYQTAPDFGIAQRRPGGGFGQVGRFEIRGIDPFYDPVSYRFFINPITRSGFGEWSATGPGLWPVDEFQFADDEPNVPGARCVRYRLRPSREQSCDVRLWIDEKSRAPRRRTVSYEQDGRRVRVVEEYRGFSTKDFKDNRAFATQLADALLVRGKLSTQIDGQWEPTEWLVKKRVYRVEEETEIWYERDGRVVLAKGSEVLINGNELTLQQGRVSIAHRTQSRLSLNLGGVQFYTISFTAGRSRITASPDRIFIEQGSTVASRGNLEKNVKLHEGVEYLVRDGRPEPQPKRTLPAEPDWGETKRTFFQLGFTQPEPLEKSLIQGEAAERDGRHVIQTTTQGDEKDARLNCVLPDDEIVPLTPNTAIRFRYFFTGESGSIRLSLHNRTSDKTYEHSLVAPQSRHWTTFEAPLAELNCIGPGPDIAKNSQPGDTLDRVQWSVYTTDGNVLIDRLEFFEWKDDNTADPWRNVRSVRIADPSHDGITGARSAESIGELAERIEQHSSAYPAAGRKTAEALLKKAQALEPDNADWSQRLGQLYRVSFKGAVGGERQALAEKSMQQFEHAIAHQQDASQVYYLLVPLAEVSLAAGSAEKAELYSNQLLEMAKGRERNWNTGNAIHTGNLILGRLSLMKGDVDRAKTHLLEAGRAPKSPQLMSFGPDMTLAKELLAKDQTDVVLEYLQLCKAFWASDKLDRWIAIIKAGQLPDFGANLVR